MKTVDMTKLPKIVAVDFDGTLVEDKFPDIGQPYPEMFSVCRELRKRGIKLVLWTSRDDNTPEKNLTAAVNFCRENGLEFDAINRNIPEVIRMFHNDTRKVYADLYIDDKSVVSYQAPSLWVERLGIPWSIMRSALYGNYGIGVGYGIGN